MDDDFENMCPLCVLPFNDQDMLFRPCGCGFRICSWCWHKIVDDAGQAGESTVDTIAKCPNCREPFDVAATLEQQARNQATIAQLNKSRPKRKAVAAKQSVVDNVYVDGKSVVVRNMPSDTFFPLIIRRLRDRHIETYEKEIAATHGTAAGPTAAEKKKAAALAAAAANASAGLNNDGGAGMEEDEDEDDTFAEALIDDSSDEEDSAAPQPFSPHPTPTATGSAALLPQPFPFAFVPPCRNKKDMAEVLKSILLADHLTAAEDAELIRLIVERRNDFPYQHIYSRRTDRLEAAAPHIVAPTLEHLQMLVGVPTVEGSMLPSEYDGADASGGYGGGGRHHHGHGHHHHQFHHPPADTHSPLTTGYPPRAPTLGRPQLALFSRYESDLWSWVEHFLTPSASSLNPSATTTPKLGAADANSSSNPSPSSPNIAHTTTVTSSVPYWNHSFFDSWVPADGSSRLARRAMLSEEALRNPMIPPALAAALASQNAAAIALEKEKARIAAGLGSSSSQQQQQTAAAPTTPSAAVTKPAAAANDDERPDEWDPDAAADDEEDGGDSSSAARPADGSADSASAPSAASATAAAATATARREYALLRAVAAPPLLSLDDTLAALTIEQLVADLPVLTYSAIEALVTQAIAAHKVRGQGPTAIGGFVSAATMAQHCPAAVANSRTNANADGGSGATASASAAVATTVVTTSTGGSSTLMSVVGPSSGPASSSSSLHLFPTPAAILSSVLVLLLHRRRQWYRWLTELVAAADSCVRDTINEAATNAAATSGASPSSVVSSSFEPSRVAAAASSEAVAQLRLQHLLPPALRQQQQMLSQTARAVASGVGQQQSLSRNGAAKTPLTLTPTLSAAAANGGSQLCGILDRSGVASSAAPSPSSSISASPLSFLLSSADASPTAAAADNTAAAAAADEATTTASAEPLSARPTPTATPIASKAYLLTFGVALINYLGLKEATCLTDADRLRYLRSFAALGRYGTVTDMDMCLQECQLLLNVKPDAKLYRKALQAAAGAGGGSGGDHSHSNNNTNVANASASATTIIDANGDVIVLRERKWPEELMRAMLFAGPYAPATAAEAAALTAVAATGAEGAAAMGPSLDIHLLPCQYYWTALRFNNVGEAVHCVLKASEELFPSWLGYAALAGASGDDDAAITGGIPLLSGDGDEADGGSSAKKGGIASTPKSSAATDSSNGIGFWVSPTRRIALAPRRPAVIGLAPTRYCGSYLKNAPCRKEACAELHADVSGKNALMLTSTNTETLVKNIQKHFFTPYLEAEGTLGAAVFGATATGSPAEESSNNGGMASRQGSAACYFLTMAAAATASESALSPTVNVTGGGAPEGFGMDRQGSSIVFGAAAAVVASALTGDVKTIAPLHLKMIKASDVPTFGGALLAPSPLLMADTSSSGAAAATEPSPSPSADPLRAALAALTAAFAAVPEAKITATKANADASAEDGSDALSTEQSAGALAGHLLAVVASLMNTLLRQDATSAAVTPKTVVSAPTERMATPPPQQQQQQQKGTAAAKSFALPPPAPQQHIAFVTVQLAALAQQCFAGSLVSTVTAAAATSSSADKNTNKKKKRGPTDPAQWLGLAAIADSLRSVVASSSSSSESSSGSSAAVDPLLHFADAAATADDRRALLLALLPEASALLHLHLGQLMQRITALLSDRVHRGTISANHSRLLGRAKAAAAAKAEGSSNNKQQTSAGGLVVLRNSSGGIISSASSTPLSTPTAPSSSAVGGGGATTISALQQLLSASAAAAHGSAAAAAALHDGTPAGALASLTATIRPSAVPRSSPLVSTLQTAAVALIRCLQILRHLGDIVGLSATLLQLQSASKKEKDAAAAASNSTTATAADYGGAATHDENNSAGLLAAKALIQRANFVRVLFASLQLFAQTALGPAAKVSAYNHLTTANNTNTTVTESGNAATSAALTTVTTNGVVSPSAPSPAKLAADAARARLVLEHHKLLLSLPHATNMVPNTEDRDVLVGTPTTVTISLPVAGGGGGGGGYGHHGYGHHNNHQQQQQSQTISLPARGAQEVIPADHLMGHLTQLQTGVTPSTAATCIAAPPYVAQGLAAAAYGGRGSAAAAAVAAAGGGNNGGGGHHHGGGGAQQPSVHISRSRTAGNSLVTLAVRRTKRTRRQVANALEMWSVFVPSSVLDAMGEVAQRDFSSYDAAATEASFVASALLAGPPATAAHHTADQQQQQSSSLSHAEYRVARRRIAGGHHNSHGGRGGGGGRYHHQGHGNHFAHNGAAEEEVVVATTPYAAIRHALAALLLPHQWAAAVRYWQLAPTVATRAGTSGVCVGASAFAPTSLLTVGSVLRASASSSSSTALASAVDPHGATAESRLFTDGLARLRCAGASTTAELSLFQQLSSGSNAAPLPTVSTAASALDAVEVIAKNSAIAAAAAHHHNSHHHSHGNSGGHYHQQGHQQQQHHHNARSNGFDHGSNHQPHHNQQQQQQQQQRSQQKSGGGGHHQQSQNQQQQQSKSGNNNAHNNNSNAARPPNPPVNAWGASSKPIAAVLGASVTVGGTVVPAPAALTPPPAAGTTPPSATPTPNPAPAPAPTPAPAPVAANPWGNKAAALAAVAPVAAAKAAVTTAPAPAAATPARPSAWGNLPALGTSAPSSAAATPQPVRSFASIVSAKK